LKDIKTIYNQSINRPHSAVAYVARAKRKLQA